ncbi:MAG TPA: tRNA (adenosine(37)-N6)-threonylcarbamoyltransferase complex ATPase subunit type 1 TsaE [Methylomirabilota bacterium]|nr:tRNA (adenosine(37)-N6)-threonylcarbamoyltransferase complex ATPase subunit type 1 TsaE [Methylomirabilota bacterium]
MGTIISRSPAETFALGERFGREARPGLILGLQGDLGAGKTEFAKGVAKGLGVGQRVHSPTFALLNEYRGARLPMYHIDLYRLESGREIRSAALEDYYYQRDGVTLIEWVDRLIEFAPEIKLPKLCLVRFRLMDQETREISYDDTCA